MAGCGASVNVRLKRQNSHGAFHSETNGAEYNGENPHHRPKNSRPARPAVLSVQTCSELAAARLHEAHPNCRICLPNRLARSTFAVNYYVKISGNTECSRYFEARARIGNVSGYTFKLWRFFADNNMGRL